MNSLARRVALFALALAALLFGGAAPALAQTNNSTPPKLVGYLSRDNWGFVNIMDFDYDPQGNLYVLESGFGITRVSKFRPDGTFERTFGQRGEGYGQLVGFDEPGVWSIKVGTDGFINVFADWLWTGRQWTKYAANGEFIGQRQQYEWIDGLYFKHNQAFKKTYVPTSDGGFDVTYQTIAGYGAGNWVTSGIYANQWTNQGRFVYHIDALYNVTLATDNLDPVEDREFAGNLFCVDSNGNKYILNPSQANPHVIVLGSSWNRIRTFGGAGSGDVQFNNPTDIKFLPNGNLWIHDAGNGRWQEITPTGEWVSENRTGQFPGVTPPRADINFRDFGNDLKLNLDGSYDLVVRGTYIWWADAIANDRAWSGGGHGPFIERFNQRGNLVSRFGGQPFSPWGNVNLPGVWGWGWPIDTEFTGWHSFSRPTFDVTNNGAVVTLSGYSRADQQNEANPNTNAYLKFYAPDKSLQWRVEVPESGQNGVGYWATQSRYVRIKGDKIYVFVSGTNPRTLVYDFNGQLIATGDAYPKNSANVYVFPTAVYGNSFVCNDGRAYEPTYAQDGLTFTWTQTRQVVGSVWEPNRHVQIAVDSFGRTFHANHPAANVLRSEWDGTVLPELGCWIWSVQWSVGYHCWSG